MYLDVVTTRAFSHDFSASRPSESFLLPGKNNDDKDILPITAALILDLQHLNVEWDCLNSATNGKLFYPIGHKTSLLDEEIKKTAKLPFPHEEDEDQDGEGDGKGAEGVNALTSKVLSVYVPFFASSAQKLRRKKAVNPTPSKVLNEIERPKLTDPKAEELVKMLRKNEIRLKRISKKF